MLQIAAIFSVSSGLGYLLPAIIGLESMGVPSPGETALVAAAVLAGQGHLKIWLVIVIGAASAILGDNLGYLLGRRLGREVLVSRGPFHEQRARLIEIGDRYFKRHGAKTVFIGRWIAWIRFATAWLAGINHMPLRVFFPWNAFGAITWAVTYGLLGYYGGQAVVNVAERVGIVAAIVLATVILGGFVLNHLRERRARRGAVEELNAQDLPVVQRDQTGGPADPLQQLVVRRDQTGGPAGPPAHKKVNP
jgi:membrane protein DedA with SNARE-associated domain